MQLFKQSHLLTNKPHQSSANFEETIIIEWNDKMSVLHKDIVECLCPIVGRLL